LFAAELAPESAPLAQLVTTWTHLQRLARLAVMESFQLMVIINAQVIYSQTKIIVISL